MSGAPSVVSWSIVERVVLVHNARAGYYSSGRHDC
jgi:hypothetical protein